MGTLRSFTIVGGGTAGWMTALYIKKLFPSSSVSVLESPDIGIIGAGEGSTVSMITFLQDLGLDLKEVLNATDGTVKLGIKFTNWNGDDNYYYHPFGPYLGKYPYNLGKFNFDSGKTRSTSTNDEGRIFLSLGGVNDIDFTKHILNNVLSEENKISILDDNVITSLHAIHFDSYKLGEYFKKIALSRGIHYKQDEVVEVKRKENGEIVELICKTSKVVSDFYFDCTGFRRMLINSDSNKWVDYTKHLPVNTAIPFQSKIKSPLEPYTTATAMKAGWLWEIPLQSRTGAGYIYNDNYTSEEQAIKEIEETFKFTPNIIKKIKFKSGRFKNVWEGNCIAIGLSTGFTEPIEATSIMMATTQLTLLNLHLGGITHSNNKVREQYNKVVGNINDHVMEFLSFHYVTKREDSAFWKDLKTREFLPENVKNYLDIWKDQIPTSLDNHSYWDQFTPDNYLMVGEGLRIFDDFKQNWILNFKSQDIKNSKEYWNEVNSLLTKITNNCSSHEEYLKKISYD